MYYSKCYVMWAKFFLLQPTARAQPTREERRKKVHPRTPSEPFLAGVSEVVIHEGEVKCTIDINLLHVLLAGTRPLDRKICIGHWWMISTIQYLSYDTYVLPRKYCCLAFFVFWDVFYIDCAIVTVHYTIKRWQKFAVKYYGQVSK